MKLGRAANKKKQMEERIYEAGMTLFQEKGVANTTLQEICQLAGVSKGTIFNYFSSKEDIVAKFGQNQIKVLREFAEQLPDSMNTKEKIIAVLMEDIRGVKESAFSAKAALKGISEGGEKVYELESKNRRDLANIYENILKEGQKTNSDLNTSLVSDLIVSIYFHVLNKHFYHNDQRDKLETTIIASLEVIFDGIKSHIKA
ncbi:TetR/AcrR family transcriptional regulator [Robertmurraya sp. DFI.2.37]|uniref:TetR/AcrR family transcriptional regulator n=1 Tax=Robertmurraya sp. DFI.2.37 TaxID=3031819 RepID=UPI0012480300|nr:TetR/AcrR family transcriptional regulator [Robertmurraya sp. DFI.2.37]MDF1507923.1 TetR/AcrR family transcriptional regulator [Robertmurraya sp. DFI.2.37]